MYRKCNTHITALFHIKQGNRVPSPLHWQVLQQENDHLFVLYRTFFGSVAYAPFYILRFPFYKVINVKQTKWYFERTEHPEQLVSTADKLRYYRCGKRLFQSEVADYAGINTSTYLSYESGGRDYYPIDKMKRIASLLDVDILELLDDYNRFLYDGQGKQIRKLRKSMGLTQYQFGKRMGVSTGAVKRWENDRVVIFKSTWEKLVHLAHTIREQKTDRKA